jgi:competence protein ComEA
MDATDVSATAPTPASAAGLGGGRKTTPAGWSGLRQRLTQHLLGSVWAPVAGKALAIGAGMLALAAIGATSTLAGAGVAVSPSASASVGPGGVWLAPDPAAARSPGAPAADPAPQGGVTAPAPSAGGTGGGAPAPGTAPPPAPGSGVTADGKIILNTATAEDLMKLPRVGPKRAQAILELRQRLGHFRQATDLLRVRGIGRKTLKQLLPLLVVDAPVPRPGAEGPSSPGAR